MAQKRIHDYRGPRSSENLNDHLVGIVPPGVYQGFQVSALGVISPGVLLTAEGVRIEETEPIQLQIPVGAPGLPRTDLVVCVHEYLKTVPPEPARYEVVTGVPGPSRPVPPLPANAILLATCRMEMGGEVWYTATQASPPARVVNAALQPDHTWKILRGALGAMLERYDPNTGKLTVHLVAPGALQDGAVITWGNPVLSMAAAGVDQILALQELLEDQVELLETEDGLLATAIAGHKNQSSGAHAASAVSLADAAGRYTATEVEAALAELAGAGRTTETVKVNAAAIADLQSGKLDKSGGTVTGDLTLNGKVTFDADDAANIAFDDWVAFKRTLPACAGHSGHWLFADGHWTSVSSPGYPRSVNVPVEMLDGAELTGVAVLVENTHPTETRDLTLQVMVLESPGGIYSERATKLKTLAAATSEEVTATILTMPFEGLSLDDCEFAELVVSSEQANVRIRCVRAEYRRKRVVVYAVPA